MDADVLRSELADAGELLLNVADFETPIELHLHDTEIGDELVTLQLSDGVLKFDVDEVVGFWKHYHSTGDYGLD